MLDELKIDTKAEENLVEPRLVDVFVVTPEELQALMEAIGELPTKFGSGIYRGLEQVAARGTVKVQVED